MVLQSPGPVLMFETLSSTPPLSPMSEPDAMVVPQLPGTPRSGSRRHSHSRSMVISGGGDYEEGPAEAPVGWADLYNLMSDLPDLPLKSADISGAAPNWDSAPQTPLTPSFSAPGLPAAAHREPFAAAVLPELDEGAAAGQEAQPFGDTGRRPAAEPAVVAAARSPPPGLTVITDAAELGGRARPASARIKARKSSAGVGAAGKRSRRSPALKRETRDTYSSSPAVSPAPAATRGPRALAAGLGRVAGLPAGHKPARGRGRQLQLASMSVDQKKAEAKARLEKNRQAAREFRTRRKEHVVELEIQVSEFETRDAEQAGEIRALRDQIARLQQQLARAQHQHHR